MGMIEVHTHHQVTVLTKRLFSPQGHFIYLCNQRTVCLGLVENRGFRTGKETGLFSHWIQLCSNEINMSIFKESDTT